MLIENMIRDNVGPEIKTPLNRLSPQKVFVRNYDVDTRIFITYLREAQLEGLEPKAVTQDISHLFKREPRSVLRSTVYISQEKIDEYDRRFPERKKCLDIPMYRPSGVTPNRVMLMPGEKRRGRPKGKKV